MRPADMQQVIASQNAEIARLAARVRELETAADGDQREAKRLRRRVENLEAVNERLRCAEGSGDDG